MEVSGESREYRQLVNEFQYSGLDTCAVDGLCQTDCPVGINTGDLVKRLRSEQHGKFSKGVAEMLSHQFKLVERLLKGLLFLGNLMNTLFGKRFMPRFTSGIKKVIPSMPLWWNELGKPPGQLYQHPDNPQYVYLSACIQRMMGNDMEKGSVQQAMLEACKNAGLSMLLPKDLSGHCCGQAFSSKGYFDAAYIRQRALIDALWKWTKEGKLPVVCDFSSCTYTLLKAGSHLEESYREKLSKLIIYDSIQFLKEVVLPELPAIEKKTKVVLHPGCAASKMELAGAMKELAAQCAENVVIPADAGCCGMAGDRGFLFPELTKGATAKELNEAAENSADGYYASAKTCEMALTHFSGKPYRHIVYLVNEATEKT
jgi:D-lactate dehydrogenase